MTPFDFEEIREREGGGEEDQILDEVREMRQRLQISMNPADQPRITIPYDSYFIDTNSIEHLNEDSL